MRRVLKIFFIQKLPSCLFFMIFLLRLLLFFNDFNCYYYTHFINGRENTLNCCHCFTHFIDRKLTITGNQYKMNALLFNHLQNKTSRIRNVKGKNKNVLEPLKSSISHKKSSRRYLNPQFLKNE